MVSERFIAGSVELQEGFEFCFLVSVLFFRSQHPIKKFSNGPSNRSFETLVQSKRNLVWRVMAIPRRYISPRTRGEQAAPIERP